MIWNCSEGLFIFTTNLDNDAPEDTGTIVFEALGIEISQKKIIGCYRQTRQSHGLDYILNEYFLEFNGILLLYLNIIFNRILSSGYFPMQWSDAVILLVF